MRRARHWLALVVTLVTLTPSRPAAAQVLDPIQYTLFSQSQLAYGCMGPCACPVVFTPTMSGTFTFYRTSVDPLYTHYALLNIVWRYPVPGTAKTATITGHGTYDIGGEVAFMHRMQLDVTTDGVLQQHFDSGLVPVCPCPGGVHVPTIDIEVHSRQNVCIDSVLHVAAGPGTESVPPGSPAIQLTTTPNPTRSSADVVLMLARADAGEIVVLNVAGARVALLARGTFAAGENRWRWDGRTTSGADAGAGVFWVRARLGTRTVTQGFVRLR